MIARPASGICHRPEAARAPISVLLPEPGPPVMTMKLSLAASKFTAQPFSLSLTALAAAKVSFFDAAIWIRSEEHTSELQSLMRISYAVFGLKKNKHTNLHQYLPPHL